MDGAWRITLHRTIQALKLLALVLRCKDPLLQRTRKDTALEVRSVLHNELPDNKRRNCVRGAWP